MVYFRFWFAYNTVTRILHSPAKVNFFLMCKKVVVEATNFKEKLSADEQCCTAYPEAVLACVVLAVVGFEVLEKPTAAKRIAVFVDIAASSTCVFKLVAVVVVDKLWSALLWGRCP